MIYKKDLIDGHLYSGISSKTETAIWCESEQVFKYMATQIFTVIEDNLTHPDDGTIGESFIPIKDMTIVS